MTIQALPVEERPRERLRACGPDALSSAELLAILLGSGTRGKSVLALAHELLARFGTLSDLSDVSLAELVEIKGLGEAKALQLLAVFALMKRVNPPEVDRPHIATAKAAYHLLAPEMEPLKEEHLVALFLDAKNRLIGKETVAIGTLTELLVHPRELFYRAVRYKAASVVVAHNHPSGDSTPSDADLELTVNLVQAGEILGIPLQDHLVIGKKSYRSLIEHVGTGSRRRKSGRHSR